MPSASLNRLLEELEGSRSRFSPGAARQVEVLLAELGCRDFPSPSQLIRFHEALLFLRAFPQGPGVLRRTVRLLDTFHERVVALGRRGADMEEFEPIEVSGIAGTVMEDTLGLDRARWLARRFPRHVGIDWGEYEDERALGATLPRFVPLLDEDAEVEASIPWLRWLRSAQGRRGSLLQWLIERFDELPLADREKAELYDSLRLPVQWKLGNLQLSRTRNWSRPRSVYYHQEPLIPRKAVSLKEMLAEPGPLLEPLPLSEGKAVMDRIREVMLVRYRELYGTTLGDPHSVVRAEVGRGVVIYLWNLQPARRLPLRAYLAGLTLKNGVPVNYIEAIGLCEWIELGFNTFYTFRGGETAWIFAQVLRCLHRRMGAECISIYPYQIGQGNEEALQSGAFWFYRKLGFRPGRRDLLRLAEREEKRMAMDPRHRTSTQVLKRLAQGHIFYHLPGSEPGAWDRFSVRNLGLRVNRRMGREFYGDSARLRRSSAARVGRALGGTGKRWSAPEQQAFADWALVLTLVPDLRRWTKQEKRELVHLIRAKAGPDEMRYLRLTQGHARLRREIIRLGSRSA